MAAKRGGAAVAERFWNKVQRGEGCWLWQGATAGGYGNFWLNGKSVRAHRFAYERQKGAIPEGLDLDHLCRNRLCVRADHLEAVTRRANLLRGNTIQAANANKTHCLNGHPFDEANTYLNSNGSRRCRACKRNRRAGSNPAPAPKATWNRVQFADERLEQLADWYRRVLSKRKDEAPKAS